MRSFERSIRTMPTLVGGRHVSVPVRNWIYQCDARVSTISSGLKRINDSQIYSCSDCEVSYGQPGSDGSNAYAISVCKSKSYRIAPIPASIISLEAARNISLTRSAAWTTNSAAPSSLRLSHQSMACLT